MLLRQPELLSVSSTVSLKTGSSVHLVQLASASMETLSGVSRSSPSLLLITNRPTINSFYTSVARLPWRDHTCLSSLAVHLSPPMAGMDGWMDGGRSWFTNVELLFFKCQMCQNTDNLRQKNGPPTRIPVSFLLNEECGLCSARLQLFAL